MGERRVYLIEAYQLLTALGADPVKEVAEVMRKFDKMVKEMNPKR